MNGLDLVRRGEAARILASAVAVALLIAAVALLTGGGPAAAARHATAAQAVLTLRTDGDHDALWLVPPAGGAATAAGTLPGIAASAAVSPDGTTVAYLPEQGKPYVWIGHGPLAPKTIPLQAAGIKTVRDMTWIAADTLLVSGSRKANDGNGYANGLYTVDVKTGSVASFRSLSGVEPSADVTTGKIAYVHFKKLDNGSVGNLHTPKYRESLMLTSVAGPGAGTTLDSWEYRPLAAGRAFSRPQLASGAHWLIAARTGSDVSVTYNVYYVGDGYMQTWLTMPQATPQAAAWAADGHSVAFGGDTVQPGNPQPCVYVADVTTSALARTPAALLSGTSVFWVTDVAWSDGGMLVADALDDSTSEGDPDSTHVLLIDSGLSTVKDLGVGHQSVWVK